MLDDVGAGLVDGQLDFAHVALVEAKSTCSIGNEASDVSE
jgi:hypothetical protein